MERECDLCQTIGKCYYLPCSSSYFPTVIDIEEPILDHKAMQRICGKCIFNLGNRCPFCLKKYVIRYNISKTRYYVNIFTTAVFTLTLLLSISLSYMGVINTYESYWYERVGFGIDLIFNAGIILYCIAKFDWNINSTILYLWILSISNICYSVLFFFHLQMYGNGFIHFTINLMIFQLYFFGQRFCCNSTRCQSIDTILELVMI